MYNGFHAFRTGGTSTLKEKPLNTSRSKNRTKREMKELNCWDRNLSFTLYEYQKKNDDTLCHPLLYTHTHRSLAVKCPLSWTKPQALIIENEGHDLNHQSHPMSKKKREKRKAHPSKYGRPSFSFCRNLLERGKFQKEKKKHEHEHEHTRWKTRV